MYNNVFDNVSLEKAGAYKISKIYLTSYRSPDGGNLTYREEISSLVQEINIYEHLESKTLSGDITLFDATNLIARLPLTGYERIEFKLSTPGLEKGYDFLQESGHPMFVYKISNQREAGPRAQMYSLHFCSMETIKNEQSRISRAFSGPIAGFVQEIVRTSLDSKKNLLIEESKDLTKLVIPNLKPFDTIGFIGLHTKSKNFANTGYLFYENSIGFNFKSYENMFTLGNGSPRPAMGSYSPRPKNIRNNGNKNILADLQSIEDFRIISHYNTLKNLKQGAYASRLITHDTFNKVFETYDFDYLEDYIQHHHLETDANGGKRDDNGILPNFNFSKGKRLSNFYDGTLFVESNTRKVHNDYELPNASELTQKRISQKAALSSLVIEFTVPGFTGINVGDVVNLRMPSYYPNKNIMATDDFDPYLSGRYLISGLRHNISQMDKEHQMVVECVKDSYHIGFPEEPLDLFTDKENDKGATYLQYDIDSNV